MIVLRDYQQVVEDEIYLKWAINPLATVLAVKPTGAGKTVLMGSIISKHVGAVCAIAHRQELVEQISLSLASFGVTHHIITPRNTYRRIARKHSEKFGTVFLDPNSEKVVAGVDTLLRRNDLHLWASRVTLVVQDEAHHVMRNNKWGKAQALFPQAKGLHVTATPIRADGRGLGRHADGYVDYMVVGATMRELIDRGYLTDYKVFCPSSNVSFEDIKLASDGDFNKKQMSKRVKGSTITGDVVNTYFQHARGKRGVTFAVDIEHATEICNAYNAAGIPAAVVSGKTPDATRAHLVGQLERGELLQLVNVDLFGEGFDLPAIECVSMARPTQSYALFVQQFGRSLRLMDGKEYAMIFDHVGNVIRHGLPDIPKQWSLDARESRARGERDPDLIPMRSCVGCTQPYEAYLSVCPHCGTPFEPEGRALPEQVDGDLTELDPAILQQLRQEVDKIRNKTPEQVRSKALYATGNPIAANAAAKRHHEKQLVHSNLEHAMSYWGGHWAAKGADNKEIMKRFYFRFGVDAMTAKTLDKKDAEALTKKVIDDMVNGGSITSAH